MLRTRGAKSDLTEVLHGFPASARLGGSIEMRKRIVGVITVVALAGCPFQEPSIEKQVQQKLYDKAIAQGLRALRDDANNVDAHYFLGAAYDGKDLELDPQGATYADSSAAYLRKAAMHFGRARDLSPEKWRTPVDANLAAMFDRHFDRGVTASKTGAAAEAVVEYRLAIVADPTNFEGYYAHAAALLPLALAAATTDKRASEQMYAAALENLDMVIQLQPAETDKLVATYQAKAEVLYRLGDAKGAAEDYRKAVELETEGYETPITIHRHNPMRAEPSVVDSLAQRLADS